MINYCKTLKCLILVLVPIISIYFGYQMTYGTTKEVTNMDSGLVVILVHSMDQV